VSWEQTKDTAGINAGPEKYKQFSRDPERTPMQWDAGINAGLCNQYSKQQGKTIESEIAFLQNIFTT
jgi:glycosidase